MKRIRAFFCAKTGACRREPRRGGASGRRVAGQRDAVHDAAESVIVVDGIVLRAAVVPERERAGLPAIAAGELRLHLMAEQEIKQRRALLHREALELGGVTR